MKNIFTKRKEEVSKEDNQTKLKKYFQTHFEDMFDEFDYSYLNSLLNSILECENDEKKLKLMNQFSDGINNYLRRFKYEVDCSYNVMINSRIKGNLVLMLSYRRRVKYYEKSYLTIKKFMNKFDNTLNVQKIEENLT